MKIYIAEDEPLAAAKLKLFLEKLGESSDVSHFDNGMSALAAVENEPPDLLFLDFQMPGLTGMQVLERISGMQVIITSAFDKYAIDSFRFQVTDYLLKPYTLERLQTALNKAKENIRLQQLDRQVNAARLTVRADGKTEILQQADILYLEALKDYVRIVSEESGRRMQRLTLGTLASIGEQLDPQYFKKVHRSFIVNLRHVVKFEYPALTLTDGTQIPVSRAHRTDPSLQLKTIITH